MKKNLFFSIALLVIALLLCLLSKTGIFIHIVISILGLITLVVFTVLTKKEWKIKSLEIAMRACYGIALISGVLAMKIHDVIAIAIIHKISAVLFIVLIIGLFIHKLLINKNK